MVRVEVTLSCLDDINFEVRKTFTYDQNDWDEWTRNERETAIAVDAERFKAETIDWDYKVL
jgi:hypothetical protein